MTKQSSYQLIKDVHKIVNRLEDKTDKRMSEVEGRLDDVESKTDNLVGKIGMGVVVLSSIISGAITLIIYGVKRMLGK